MKTTTSLKIDKDVKEKAAKLAASLGLTLSAVINNSLRKFIADKKVSFEEEPRFNKATSRRLNKALEDIKNGKNLSPAFDNAKDAIAWLNRNS
ncbi:MAG: type II toxin-antitoxin system RelB/DinJ family antitoxin [bacterium]